MLSRAWRVGGHGGGAARAAGTAPWAAAASAAAVFGLVGHRSPSRAEDGELRRHPWSVDARLLAMHQLLLDLAAVPEVKVGGDAAVPKLLEEFWQELGNSDLPTVPREYFLHRLAEDFGHGTLRLAAAAELAERLRTLGVRAVLDPLAHTGLHAWHWERQGFMVEAADFDPPAERRCWHQVVQRPVADTPWHHFGADWALFLSWLPHWSEMGVEALRGFQGDVVIVLGDTGDWTGTGAFREALATDWSLVAALSARSPWPRVDESVCLYVRSSKQSRET